MTLILAACFIILTMVALDHLAIRASRRRTDDAFSRQMARTRPSGEPGAVPGMEAGPMNEYRNSGSRTVSNEVTAASWSTSYERYLLAEAMAENEALLSEAREKAFDGDAADANGSLTVVFVVFVLLAAVAGFFGVLIWALHAIALRAFT